MYLLTVSLIVIIYNKSITDHIVAFSDSSTNLSHIITNSRNNSHCLAICFLLELHIKCVNVKKWLIKPIKHQQWCFLPESHIVTALEVMQRWTWGFKAKLLSVVCQIIISLTEGHQVFYSTVSQSRIQTHLSTPLHKHILLLFITLEHNNPFV